MFGKLQEKLKAMSDASDKKFADIIDKIKVPSEIQEERFNICLQCDKLYKPSSSCKICGCFMKVKTTLPGAECPIKKWGKYTAHIENK